jgi:hypothetical protein
MRTDTERLDTELLRHYGKYPAFVISNAPPDDGAAHRGEVLVRIPGLLEEDPTDPTGMTSRPMEVLAKPCLPPGFFFVPEKGDQLWVEFAAGMVDEPLWSGAWYPKDKAPKTDDGKAPTEFQKVIRTAKEHVVLLDNTDGKERVVVLDGKNKNKLTFDSKGMVLEDANGNTVSLTSDGIELADKNKNKLTMDSNGIVLQNAASMKFELGSTGAKVSDATGGGPQGIALAPLLDWLLAHQHVGNMGAPTPLFPADIVKINPPLKLMLVSSP